MQQHRVGGQFMLGAWAVILLHDYLLGRDFALESTVMRLSLHTFTPENVQTYYRKIVASNHWERVDFRVFSKIYEPQRMKYHFGLEPILDQIADAEPARPAHSQP